MKTLVKLLLLIFLVKICACPQAQEGCPQPISTILDRLWTDATLGELLNPDGWHRATGFFLNPTPWPGNKMIWVVSNHWGPADLFSRNGDEAEVMMGYFDAGVIDGDLRYKPPKPSRAVKTSLIYHLRLAPTRWNTYKSDGKTVDKVMTGPRAWQIEGPEPPPWTTINTAIRYVLERRARAKDPQLKKNADQTIAQLLKWQ